MSNTVPEGWAIRPLNGKVEILSGYPFKSSLFCDDPSKMGVVRIRDLVKQSIETFYAGDFDDEYVVRRGDILIGMDGDFNIVKWKAKNALLNQRICKVKASKDGGFDSDFLFHSLVDDLDSIHSATGATTVKHLSVKDIKGIEKAYPPLPEQQKIAAILSSVDGVIEKTRTQIDKLKDLKTGMMQELLTKGVGHSEFKDSPAGRIPVTWKVVQIQDVATVIRGASPRPQGDPRYYGGSVPRLMVKDVTRDGKYVTPKIDFLTDAGAKLSRPVPAGTLTIVCSGMVGVPAFLSVDACIHDGFLALKKIAPQCDPEFLYYQLVPMQSIFDSSATHGGIFTNLTTQILKEFQVVLPPLNEQLEIAKSLSTLDNHLNGTLHKLRSYEGLKKALMQDLLTGKVRVKVDQKESAVA